jgi:hypothetical protein
MFDTNHSRVAPWFAAEQPIESAKANHHVLHFPQIRKSMFLWVATSKRQTHLADKPREH